VAYFKVKSRNQSTGTEEYQIDVS